LKKAFHFAEGQYMLSAFVIILKPFVEFYAWDFHSKKKAKMTPKEKKAAKKHKKEAMGLFANDI